MEFRRWVLPLSLSAALAAGEALAQPPPAKGPVVVGVKQDIPKLQVPPLVQTGTYHCRGFWNANLEALSFRLNGDGAYTSLSGQSRGTWELKDRKVHFHGGHLDGEVGDLRWHDAIKLGVETCSRV